MKKLIVLQKLPKIAGLEPVKIGPVERVIICMCSVINDKVANILLKKCKRARNSSVVNEVKK